MVCYDQTIFDDLSLELPEYIGLGLAGGDILTEVEPMYNNSVIIIIDDDCESPSVYNVYVIICMRNTHNINC